jgi:hypothetical protein
MSEQIFVLPINMVISFGFMTGKEAISLFPAANLVLIVVIAFIFN